MTNDFRKVACGGHFLLLHQAESSRVYHKKPEMNCLIPRKASRLYKVGRKADSVTLEFYEGEMASWNTRTVDYHIIFLAFPRGMGLLSHFTLTPSVNYHTI